MATAISSKQLTSARSKFAGLVDGLTQPFVRSRRLPAPITRTQPVTLLSVETHAGPNGITTLCLTGELTHMSTATFDAAARAAYAAGATALVVDMAGICKLSMAGLFTLHNAARLVAGAPRLNPDDGWSALHAMHASAIAVNGPYLRLTNVPPAIEPFLTANGVAVRD